MATKKLSALIQIGGAVASSLSGALGKTSKEIKKVGNTVKELGRTQEKIQQAAALERQIKKDAEAAGQAIVKFNGLKKVYDLTGQSNKKLADAMKKTEGELQKVGTRLQQNIEKFRIYDAELKKAGIDTSKLANEEARLGRAMARTRLGGKAIGIAQSGAEKARNMRDAGAGQVFGSFAMALPMIGAAKATADFDSELQLMANTAEMTDARMQELRKTILGLTSKTNQSSQNLLTGLKSLIAAGMDEEKAVGNIELIGRAATATKSEVEDLAKTVFSLSDNLGVANSDMAYSIDILAKAGKQGNFELSEMAKEFPKITAMAAALKLQGVEGVATLGAALEVARKGAGSGEEAANNLVNFLAKIQAPQTMRKFQKMGFDINKTIQTAIEKGENPLEAAIQTVAKATKGGDEKMLGALFEDMQVKNFIRPMIQHWKEYQQIKEDSLGSKGTIERDFGRMMSTNSERFQGVVVQAMRLSTVLGDALGPTINDVIKGMKWLADGLEKFNKAHPGVVGNVIRFTAGLIMLNGAIGAFKWILGAALAPLFQFGTWLFDLLGPARVGMIVESLGGFGTRLLGLTRSFGSLFRFLPAGIGIIARLIGLIPGWGWALAGIVTVVGLLIANWKTVGSVIQSAWNAAVGATQRAWSIMRPIVEAVGSAVGGLFGMSGKKVPVGLAPGGRGASNVVPMPRPRGAGGNTYTDNSKVNIVIHPAGNLNEAALAKEIEKAMERNRQQQKRRALYDQR